MSAESLASDAQALAERARWHKRESDRHRKAARACRARQAELEAQCRRLGIAVETIGEGEIHGRHDKGATGT